MLIKMRSVVAKIFVFTLFGLLILSFALWGVTDFFQGPGRSTAVAEVGDRAIDQHEFSRDLNIEMARLGQQLNRRLTLEQAAAFGIVDQVVQRLVARALFDEQAADMGLVVSEAQLRTEIVKDPSFLDGSGNFDPLRFEHSLRNRSMSEQQYLLTLRRDIQRRQLIGPMTGTEAAPKAVAEQVHAFRGESRSAEALRLPVERIALPADPDEATLQAFYEAEERSFMAPETRAVTFLELGLKDVEDEITIGDEEARQAFEERSDDFLTPERRRVSQIVFSDQAAAEAAHAKIAGGATFEAAAEGSQSGAPVPLGTLSRVELEQLLPALAAPAFALEAGGASEPFASDFGWHIVHVSDIQEGDTGEFEALKDKIKAALKAEQSIDTIVSIANDLDDQLARGRTIEEMADTMALDVRQVSAVDSTGNDGNGNAVEDLPQQAEFLRTVFETETGEDSLLLGSENEGYFILRVDDVTPSALRTLDEVRVQAIELWKADERLRLVQEQAEALAERANGGESFAEIAESEGLAVETLGPLTRFDSNPTSGASRDVVERLFELDAGSAGAAPSGDGATLFKLTEVTPAESGDSDGVERIQGQLAQLMQQDLLDAFSRTLYANHSVNVNQPLIEELVTGIPRY